MRKYFSRFVLGSLRWATKDVLRHSRAKIVGVTGSVGKSSYVYLLDAVVREKFKTKTTFSGNSETGIPLEILGIRQLVGNYSLFNWLKIMLALPGAYLKNRFNFGYDLVIVEMGVDSPLPPKNMEYLLGMVKPDIGVMLSVTMAHSQEYADYFRTSSREKILRAITLEKGKIVTRLAKRKVAIINTDYNYIREIQKVVVARKVTYGQEKKADLYLVDHKLDINGTRFTFRFMGKNRVIKISKYLLSREQVTNILAVIATAVELGIEIDEICWMIERKFVLPPGRMSLIEGVSGSRIIDSSYNASPAAVEISLRMFMDLPISKGRKFVVLGDMRELGAMEEFEHRDLAKYIDNRFSKVFLVGEAMGNYLYPELLRKKVVAEKFDNSEKVGEYLKENYHLGKNDWVLIKGSQNTIYLEQVVKDLMKNPLQAKKLLCRQSDYWEKVRQEYYAKQ